MTSREDSCNRGIAFHAHHDILVDWCPDFNERVEEIKKTKPKEEQPLRLRVFRLIPNDRLPSKLKTAYEIYDQAEKAYIRTRETYEKAEEIRGKTWEARCRALEARCRALEAYDNTWEACGKAEEAHNKTEEACIRALEACMPQLERLHKELCPDRPWNGQTIFTRQNDTGNGIKRKGGQKWLKK